MNEINDKDIVRLRHIIDAINELEAFLADKNEEEFQVNTMLQSACIRQLEIIGEAASKLEDNSVRNDSNIEWREIIGLRNLLIHEYFGVDLSIVWQILKFDIPVLKGKINLFFL